jgi:hypothetical protein
MLRTFVLKQWRFFYVSHLLRRGTILRSERPLILTPICCALNEERNHLFEHLRFWCVRHELGSNSRPPRRKVKALPLGYRSSLFQPYILFSFQMGKNVLSISYYEGRGWFDVFNSKSITAECYTCDFVSSPENCTKTSVCLPTEVCSYLPIHVFRTQLS